VTKVMFIIVGLIYGVVSSHYVAQGIRTKLSSIGRQVFKGLWNRRSVIV
jgi:preprotein translocase subunit SecF